MKILLDKKESEDYFYHSLCNGLGEMRGYNLSIEFDEDKYAKAKETLKAKEVEDIYYESVLMQILREGGTITLRDGDGDASTSSITMNDVHERVQNSPIRHMVDMINQRDDAITADVIIQTVFFGKVIFG
jgi:hypothetical protein